MLTLLITKYKAKVWKEENASGISRNQRKEEMDFRKKELEASVEKQKQQKGITMN